MAKPKLILDYDGTLTDVKANFSEYKERFKNIFSSITEIPLSKLNRIEEVVRKEVEKDPTRGWENNGAIVAPALTDPYMLNVTVYQGICSKLKMSVEERDNLLGMCYKEAYSASSTTFKNGLDEFLHDVQDKYDVSVVTNSSKKNVAKDLEGVDFPSNLVFGGARKYVLDQDWQEIPISTQPPDFPRPVMLRRKNYFQVLKRLEASHLDTTVLGDIYEIDLALPDYLGLEIVHMTNESTPSYETDYINKHPNGSVVKDLEEAREVLL